MTLMARFSGTCRECGGRWQPGDLIRSDATTGNGVPIWQHATCPDDVADPLAAEYPACPVCFLVHPVGKCDR